MLLNYKCITLRAADRWRVILKGEQPDYIHAVSINVCVPQPLKSLITMLYIDGLRYNITKRVDSP